MKNLFIFNPETDFAQADSNGNYTPNAKIRTLRRNMALVQSEIASLGDAILLLDGQRASDLPALPHYTTFREKHLSALFYEDLRRLDYSNWHILPWGWNPTLRRRLLRYGADPASVPTEEQLNALRLLTHRRTTIAFHKELRRLGIHYNIGIPMEFQRFGKLEDWLKQHPDCYLKAPWSSSGRGVIHTAAFPRDVITKWAKGVISRQGSIMAEPAMHKSIDFATEWECRDGEALFLGYSVFSTGTNSNYLGNTPGNEEMLLDEICRYAKQEDVLTAKECQRIAINNTISTHYSGPLGIDMLTDASGNINACIEINLRTTMGHIALKTIKA